MGIYRERALTRVRAAAKTVLRYTPGLRQWSRARWWAFERRNYEKLTGSLPVNPKMVVFSCFMGRSFADSPRAIYETMCADPRFDDWELWWIFREDRLEQFRADPRLSRAKIVRRSSEEYQRILGTAKYWVFNARCPEYVLPKPDQIYVQCWHGTPLKRLGYDVQIDTTNALNTTLELAGRFEMDSAKWTYLISPSAFTSQHLADAFGLAEERRADVVLEVGYPRNDAIARACETPESLAAAKARIMDELGVPEGKKLLLYAPTWRDNDYKAGVGYVQDTLVDFDLLKHELGDEWCVLFRPHYYIANEFNFARYGDFVFNAASVPDINDLYIIADACMTDYSSVFFDYAITGRPLLFYWPDYEFYDDHVRGFYFDPHTIPGPKCTTTAEVVDAVKALGMWEETCGEDYARFRAEFCPKDDGHAAERVVERIFFPEGDPSTPGLRPSAQDDKVAPVILSGASASERSRRIPDEDDA